MIISYKEAHVVQQEIIKLTEKEYKQHNFNKNKKIKEESDLLLAAQKKEYESTTHKFLSKYSELKKERALKFDELLQKYKNKHKELESSQKTEMKEFEKPSKTTFIKVRAGMTNMGK